MSLHLQAMGLGCGQHGLGHCEELLRPATLCPLSQQSPRGPHAQRRTHTRAPTALLLTEKTRNHLHVPQRDQPAGDAPQCLEAGTAPRRQAGRQQESHGCALSQASVQALQAIDLINSGNPTAGGRIALPFYRGETEASRGSATCTGSHAPRQ